MKNLLLFTILITTSLTFVASQAQSAFKDTGIDTYISKLPIPKDKDLNYTGTPYAKEGFQKGIVTKNRITIGHNTGLRYNANKDIFEIKKTFTLKDNQAKLLTRSGEIVLEVNKNTLVYIPINASNKNFRLFCITLQRRKHNVT